MSPSSEHVNTLMERLSCRPQFDANLTNKIQNRYKVGKQHIEEKIREEEITLKQLRDKTDVAQRSYKDRILNLPISYEDTIQRIWLDQEEEDEVEEVVYPTLTNEQQNIIKKVLFGGPQGEVIINKFNMSITRTDLNTLCGMTWLNDEVINFYMNLVMERSEERTDLPRAYCFNTFFIPTLASRGHAGVKRWTRKVDIFTYDVLPVPVHVSGVHWCMAIIRMKDKIIRYYDSMGNSNPNVLDNLERYLMEESMDKRKVSLDTSDWKKECIRDCPQQGNGSDCGVFSCMFAEHLTRNASLKFSQNEMPYFRQKMVLEIATGKLIM